jgi:thiosulfate dehydrogenase [quinone] large subunit
MAGQPVWDWLFMIGLLGIGLALFTGIGMRVAAAAGALLYMLMYAAVLPLENNPIVDDHLIGAIVLVVLALTLAGDTWGAGRAWARTHLVHRYPVLR